MNPGLPMSELIGGALGFFFTLAILSYIFGENPLFRFALHVFIGVSAGYIGLITIHEVISPRFVSTLQTKDTLALSIIVVPLILFLFLVMKLSTRTSAIGNIGVGYMLGVGVGTAVGSAVTGTLIPQVQATFLSIFPNAGMDALNNLVVIIGTISSLLFFQSWLNPRSKGTDGDEKFGFTRLVSTVGKSFITLSLGAVYGGLIISGIAIFAERIVFLVTFIQQFTGK